MRFGIFYEHQLPRPWAPDGEHRVLHEALEQVEVAERAGFDYVWAVEHHFLEEYSHCAAPEVFLGAASQRTRRIRLGHGIVQLPPAVNHPARVAERVATLDLVSDGRVEFGTGEGSSAAELGGFLVPRERKRAQWEEALDAVTRMWVETPYGGHTGEGFSMPPRNVVPKPRQRPHPPLWVACSRRDTIHLAARRGLGALSFSFAEPEDAAAWVREYYALVESDACVPAGFRVDPAVAVVLPLMCHEDEEVAIERGIDGAHFFAFALAHFYGASSHEPGRTDVWSEFLARRDEIGLARALVRADKAPLSVRMLEQGIGSLRGAIGTPAQVRELLRRYEDAGVDQVAFLVQTGRTRHEHACESLELVGRAVLPEFAARAPQRERAKAERLGPAVAAALARRPSAREPVRVPIDEPAELARASRLGGGPWARRGGARRVVREALRGGGAAALRRAVANASDEELERRFGSAAVQGAIFTAMARGFDPGVARGFEGDVVYELRWSGNGRPPGRWTLHVDGGRARVRRGAAPNAALRVTISLADFARMAAGALNPMAATLEGRTDVEGDLALALRLTEMFGGRVPY